MDQLFKKIPRCTYNFDKKSQKFTFFIFTYLELITYIYFILPGYMLNSLETIWRLWTYSNKSLHMYEHVKSIKKQIFVIEKENKLLHKKTFFLLSYIDVWMYMYLLVNLDKTKNCMKLFSHLFSNIKSISLNFGR